MRWKRVSVILLLVLFSGCVTLTESEEQQQVTQLIIQLEEANNRIIQCNTDKEVYAQRPTGKKCAEMMKPCNVTEIEVHMETKEIIGVKLAEAKIPMEKAFWYQSDADKEVWRMNDSYANYNYTNCSTHALNALEHIGNADAFYNTAEFKFRNISGDLALEYRKAMNYKMAANKDYIDYINKHDEFCHRNINNNRNVSFGLGFDEKRKMEIHLRDYDIVMARIDIMEKQE